MCLGGKGGGGQSFGDPAIAQANAERAALERQRLQLQQQNSRAAAEAAKQQAEFQRQQLEFQRQQAEEARKMRVEQEISTRMVDPVQVVSSVPSQHQKVSRRNLMLPGRTERAGGATSVTNPGFTGINLPI